MLVMQWLCKGLLANAGTKTAEAQGFLSGENGKGHKRVLSRKNKLYLSYSLMYYLSVKGLPAIAGIWTSWSRRSAPIPYALKPQTDTCKWALWRIWLSVSSIAKKHFHKASTRTGLSIPYFEDGNPKPDKVKKNIYQKMKFLLFLPWRSLNEACGTATNPVSLSLNTSQQRTLYFLFLFSFFIFSLFSSPL